MILKPYLALLATVTYPGHGSNTFNAFNTIININLRASSLWTKHCISETLLYTNININDILAFLIIKCSKLLWFPYSEFYHGYCEDQRNAAVIILRYTMLRHNGLWEVIHASNSCIMWGYWCVWNSKSYQLHVDFIFSIWCWMCRYRISIWQLFLYEALLLQNNPFGNGFNCW